MKINTNTIPEHTASRATPASMMDGEGGWVADRDYAEPTRRTVIDTISDYLNTYMVFTEPAHARLLALWVLHTWTFGDSFPERPYTTPYIYLNSLEPGSGKTTLLNLLRPLALNTEKADNMTSSVLFRLIESIHPTMLIDEVDALFTGTKATEEMRGVVNSGYKVGGYIWRNAPGKDGPEPRKFDTYCPKIMAGLDNGHLPETVASRSIEIILEKAGSVNTEGQLVAPDGTTRETYYEFLAAQASEHVVREIQLFIAEWAARYSRYMPKPLPGMGPRQFELAFPLLQVAHAAGVDAEAAEWIKAAFEHKPRRDTHEQAMLRSIHALFQESGAERMFSRDLFGPLGITGKKLATDLAKLGVQGGNDMTISNRTGKGYYRSQFEALWAQMGL